MSKLQISACIGILFAVVGWFGTLGFAGCKRMSRSGEIPVVVFDFHDRTRGFVSGLRFREKQCRRLFSQLLDESKEFRIVDLDSHTGPYYQANLTISLASQRKQPRNNKRGMYRALQVELSLSSRRQTERNSLSASGKAFELQNPRLQETQSGFMQILALAIEQAIGNIEIQTKAYNLDDEQLLALLRSPNPRERQYVLRTLRDRRVPELVPAVVEMLDDEEEEVVLEAVGVLVAQRDQSAVTSLIRLSSSRDPIFQLQLITALAELGGPIARGYLFTLAAGDSSQEVRERAREGLSRITFLENRSSRRSDSKTIALPKKTHLDGGTLR